jgi:tRNA uridine 5-carbamoylmethylation protein Kti12
VLSRPAGHSIGPVVDPVLILTGPPGAGKTTTARLLAASFPRAVHLESDAFFHFIASGHVAPWRPQSHEQNTTVMRIVATAAAGYADAGYLTIVDGIVSPDWFFPPLRDALHASGHTVAYAVLRPSVEVCIARAASRAGAELADGEVITQLWDDFAGLGPLEGHVIAGREPSADTTAVELARRLEDRSLEA